VTGPDEEIKKFCEPLNKSENISFLEMYVPHPDPMPETIEIPEHKAYLREENNPNWYDWNIINWGTKWPDDLLHVEMHEGSADLLFLTAWVPPREGVLTMSKSFPKLKFHLEFSEPMMCFRGQMVAENGSILVNEVKEWYCEYEDVPDTHSCEEAKPETRECVVSAKPKPAPEPNSFSQDKVGDEMTAVFDELFKDEEDK
jgi:hypothetical protein